MLNAMLSTSPEQKKHPKRIKSAHFASISASSRCRTCDLAWGFSKSSPIASWSITMALRIRSALSYRTDDELTLYICTTSIMIHISHDPENFQPLSDKKHRNLWALTRPRPLRGMKAMSRCTLIGASCATEPHFRARQCDHSSQQKTAQ